MAYLTKYGSLWGALPVTAGRVFWVAPAASYTVEGRSYDASNDNDGLSPERALRTINRAWALTTANVGDVIVLLPGTHTLVGSLAASKAGITMTGLPSGKGNPRRTRTVINGDTDDQLVNVTAADIEFAYMSFEATATIPTASALIDFSSAANRFYVHDCTFDVTAATASTSILGVDALGAAANVTVERCYFQADGAFGAFVDMTATVDSLVQDCDFYLQTGTLAAALTTGAATDRLIIRRCDFIDGAGTITAGIDGTGATIANGVTIHDNRFGVTVTVPIDNYDAAEAVISENYDFGVGAADGGVLVTAIT